MNFFSTIAIFCLVLNSFLCLALLIYWILIRRFRSKEYFRNLIATSFIYNFKAKRFYFEQKPWFINQHRNALDLILRLMAKTSAKQFDSFIAEIATIRRVVKPDTRPQIKVNFFLHRRIEGCEIVILKIDQTKGEALGIISNLYFNYYA